MRRLIALLVPLALWAPIGGAVQDQAGLCDQAADRAARMSGVPLDILMAISRIETGRDTGGGLQPWPWTINVAGEGAFFDDAQSALDHAAAVLDAGSENFDLGCFQLNFRWHGGAFSTLDQMIDPQTNALYAANFLAELYQTTGSWPQAVGQYHSQTGELAEAYLAKVDALLGGGLVPVGAAQSQLADDTPPPVFRENTFPLLIAGASGQGGSIVPQTSSRGSLFASNN